VKVAVIGGGVAGTAAAWAARRAGADVTAVFDRAGASGLYAGALDLYSWEEDSLDAALDSDLLAFCTALEAWSVGTRSARVATYEGLLRPARARDSSLLDLVPLAGRRVAVVATQVDGWDAASLARSLGASAWAVRTRTRFDAVPVEGVVGGAEGQASAYDLALLHDEPGRMERLAERVRGAGSGADGWLFGPWLGTTPGGAESLAASVGKPCGETTSRPGGPAGARFDASRDALFASSGVHVRRENVEGIERRGARWMLLGAAGGLTASDAGFDAVILAIGGVAGGGIVLADGSGGSKDAAFHPSVQSGVEVGFAGRPLDRASSERGADFSSLGVGVLERVGILSDGPHARGQESLYVAGDCVADLPRTALGAARSGIAAARHATMSAAGPRPLAAS
jgi:glycerol-3-phosphate dehydrogenase subunit B